MKKSKTQVLFLIAVVFFIIGVLLRGVETFSGNYLFGFDHGRDYLAVYNIVENHKQTLIGAEVGAGSAGISGLFHGPGYFYLLSIMYRLFSGDPYGGLVLMFLFGIGTLVAVFFTVKKMLGIRPALFALAFTAISPSLVTQSRFIWNHHPSTFFIVLVFYCIFRINDKPKIFLPLAFFLSSCIYHFELAVAVPLVITVMVVGIGVYRVKDFRAWLFSIVAVIVAFAPMILFELRHGFMATKGMFSYLAASGGGGIGLFEKKRFIDHISGYRWNMLNTFFENMWMPEAVQLCCVVFLCIIVFSVLRKSFLSSFRKFFSSLFICIGVSWVLFLFLNNTIWDYYLIHLHIVYIYLCAYAVSVTLKEKHSQGMNIFFFSMLTIIFSVLTVSTGWRLYDNYRYGIFDYGGIEKIKGKRAAIDFVYSDAAGKPFNAFVFMPAIYTYPYDYLFLTYGKNKYGYTPGSEKRGMVYLIIEKDLGKPWTYKGWLETVMNGGEVIFSKILPSGQIVEKHLFP